MSVESQVNETSASAQHEASLPLTGYIPPLANTRFTICTIADLSRADIQVGMALHLVPCVLQTAGLAVDQLPDPSDITVHGLELRSLDIAGGAASESDAVLFSEHSASQPSSIPFARDLPAAASQSDAWNTESLDIMQLEQQALSGAPRLSDSFLLSVRTVSQAHVISPSFSGETAGMLRESQFTNLYARRQLHRYRQCDAIFSGLEMFLEQLFSIKTIEVSGKGYAPFYDAERRCLQWSPVTIVGKCGQCFAVRKVGATEDDSDASKASRVIYCSQRKLVLSYLDIPRSLEIELSPASLNSVFPLAESQIYDIFNTNISEVRACYGCVNSDVEWGIKGGLQSPLRSPTRCSEVPDTTQHVPQKVSHIYAAQITFEPSEQIADICSIPSTEIEYSGLLSPHIRTKKNSILPERRCRSLFPPKEANSRDTIRIDFEAFLSTAFPPGKLSKAYRDRWLIQLFDKYREYHLVRSCFWKRLAVLDKLTRIKMKDKSVENAILHYLEVILQRSVTSSNRFDATALGKALMEKRRVTQLYYKALITKPVKRYDSNCNSGILKLLPLASEVQQSYFDYKMHVTVDEGCVVLSTSMEICVLSLMRTLPLFKKLLNSRTPTSYFTVQGHSVTDKHSWLGTSALRFHDYEPALDSNFVSISGISDDLSATGTTLIFSARDYCRQLAADFLMHAQYMDFQLEILMEAVRTGTHRLHSFSHTFLKLVLNGSRVWSLQEGPKSISGRTKKMYSAAQQAIEGSPFVIPGKCISAYLAFVAKVVTKCLPLISMPSSILSTIGGPYSPQIPSFIKSNMIFASDLTIEYYKQAYLKALDNSSSPFIRLIDLPTEVIQKELAQTHSKASCFVDIIGGYNGSDNELHKKRMHDLLSQLNKVSFSRRALSASTTMAHTACLRAFINPQIFNYALLINDEAVSPQRSSVHGHPPAFDIDSLYDKDPRTAIFIPYSLFDPVHDSNILMGNLSRCLANSFICFYNVVTPYIQEVLSDECYRNYRAVLEKMIAQYKIDHGLLSISPADKDRMSLRAFNGVRSLFVGILKLAEIIIHRTFHEAVEERVIPQWIIFLLITIHGGQFSAPYGSEEPALAANILDPTTLLTDQISHVLEQSFMCADYSSAGMCPETTEVVVMGLDSLTDALRKYLHLSPDTETFYNNLDSDLSVLNRGLNTKIVISSQEIANVLAHSRALEFSLLPRYDVHRRLESCYFSGDPLDWEETLPLFINDLVHYYRGRPMFCDLTLTPNLSIKLSDSFSKVPFRTNKITTEMLPYQNESDKKGIAHAECIDTISRVGSPCSQATTLADSAGSSADEPHCQTILQTDSTDVASNYAQLAVSAGASIAECGTQRSVILSMNSSASSAHERQDGTLDTALRIKTDEKCTNSSQLVYSPTIYPKLPPSDPEPTVKPFAGPYSLHYTEPDTLEHLLSLPESLFTGTSKLTLYGSFIRSFYSSNIGLKNGCVSISQFYRKITTATGHAISCRSVARAQSAAQAPKTSLTLEHKPLRPISQCRALPSRRLLDIALESDRKAVDEQSPGQFLRKALKHDLPEGDSMLLLRRMAIMAGKRVARYFRPIHHAFSIYAHKVRSHLFALLQTHDLLPQQFFSHSWLSNAILSAFLHEASKIDLLINQNIQASVRGKPTYYDDDGSFSYQKFLEKNATAKLPSYGQRIDDRWPRRNSSRLGSCGAEASDQESSLIRFQSFIGDDSYSMGHLVCSEEAENVGRGVPDGVEDAYDALRQEFAASYRYALGTTIPVQRAIELKLQLISEFISTKKLISLLPFNMPLGTPSHAEIVTALLTGSKNSCRSLVAALTQVQALVDMVSSIPGQAYYGVYSVKLSCAIAALEKECAFVMRHLCRRVMDYHTLACSILGHSMGMLEEAVGNCDGQSSALQCKLFGGVLMASMPMWSRCLQEISSALPDVSSIGSGAWPSELYGDLLKNIVDTRCRYIRIVNRIAAITGMGPAKRRVA